MRELYPRTPCLHAVDRPDRLPTPPILNRPLGPYRRDATAEPDRHALAALDHDFAVARRLYAALNAGDRHCIAALLREVSESRGGASVLMAATQLGLEFARSCESAGLLRDDDGELTVQAFLDSAALIQVQRAESTKRIAEGPTEG